MPDEEVRGIGWWAFFGLSNLLFVGFLARLVIRLARAWHLLGGRLQVDAISLVILSAAVWVCLLRERKSIACLCMASFAFDAAGDLVARLF